MLVSCPSPISCSEEMHQLYDQHDDRVSTEKTTAFCTSSACFPSSHFSRSNSGMKYNRYFLADVHATGLLRWMRYAVATVSVIALCRQYKVERCISSSLRSLNVVNLTPCAVSMTAASHLEI